MDRMRGVYMPLLFVAMAALVAFMGSLSVDDSRVLASRAQQMGTLEVVGPAPRAQAEARKRVVLKRAQQASMEGLGLYGVAGLLCAAAAVMALTHLRFFRAADVALAVGPSARPPAA